MKTHHLPSVEALTANDDSLLTAELKVSEVKEQLEIARALIDAIEQRDLLSDLEHVSDPRLVEEIARLGKAFVTIAAALAHRDPPQSQILFTAHACPR